MTVAADRVFALLETSDKQVREAAYAALPSKAAAQAADTDGPLNISSPKARSS